MKAKVGDEIKVHGQHVGDPGRLGEVVEVRGEDGAPPYVIRWSDGHEGLFYPGADAVVEHLPASPAAVPAEPVGHPG